MTTHFLTETRERFLTAVVAQLPVDRIREVYLFQPIKQGGVESGVAVVAAALLDDPAARAVDALTADASAAMPADVPSDDRSVGGPPAVGEPADERPTDRPPPAPDAPAPAADGRYTVYTARYRHVLKGIDRGKWEASVVAEADAPLLSIETVVRGVQRRAGDVDPPDRLTADELRAALRLGPPAAAS